MPQQPAPRPTDLVVFGGTGDGPGELQNPGPMGWRADTLWVLDYRGYRFSQFAPSGDFLTSFSVVAVFADKGEHYLSTDLFVDKRWTPSSRG